MPPGRISPRLRVLIVGVGNEYRSDDAVGLVIARRIREENLARTRVIEETGEGASLIESWKGMETAILLDAVHTGGVPGTVHRFDAHVQPIPARFFRHSTHSFNIAEAIELARALGQLPDRLIVYGIEAKNFRAGVGLSPEVERAVSKVVGRVVRALR